MKKGSRVLLETTDGRSILGVVVKYEEAEGGGEAVLQEVGDTSSDQLDLLKRGTTHDFRLYPKELKVTVNLWHITRTIEWTGRLPKGWKSAVAALEEAECDCKPRDEEDKKDEEDDDDDE